MITSWLPKQYREYLSLGAEIALSLSVPIILGSYADGYVDSEPFGVIIGALIGILLFFLRILRLIKDPGVDKRTTEQADKQHK
jgi:F0F1-type ATP synthase assembly protein I